MTPSATETRTPLVTVDAVTLGYGRTAVLEGLSFTIERGDFIGLVGPNGCGKTTVLRALLGLIRPRAGRVVFHDPAVRMGYVPQQRSLEGGWPLRAVDVVAMGLYDRIGVLKRPAEPHRRAAEDALDTVGMGAAASRQFASLSGGQKQRVLLARALVGHPTMLLLDEPTAGMDIVATASVLDLLARLHRDSGLTILLVSHQLNEVAAFVPRLGLFTEDGFRIGAIDEMLSDARLSAMYRVPLQVFEADGRRLVFPVSHTSGEDRSATPGRDDGAEAGSRA
ncbi:MAG: metal ABC transporter ATP-binding protein [Gemmatimonadetes bacterium]|nr:metal ABC transporter ATP-binding protein [Gemmatimonadota bacterium]